MVEMNEAERGKKEELKERRTTSEISGTLLNAPAFKFQISQKEKTQIKGKRKHLRREQSKTSLIMGRKQSLKSKKYRVPNRIHPKQTIPIYISIKLTKIKQIEQILKAAREKQQITHKGILIRTTADLSVETLQTRKEWQDILKVMKE